MAGCVRAGYTAVGLSVSRVSVAGCVRWLVVYVRLLARLLLG